MIHPDTELRFISEEIGYGVVATKFIPKGTITWAIDKLDREFTPEEEGKMDSIYRDVLKKYTYRNNLGNFILCWDNGRFVNHSFNSNCLTTAYNYEVAIRDIHPGEELTDDYGYLNVTEPFDALPEAGSDRTVVYPDDLLRYHAIWDEKVLSAMKESIKVPQPLRVLITDDIWKTAQKIAEGKEKMQSVLSCLYEEKKLV